MNDFFETQINEWSCPPVAGMNLSPLVVLPLADEQFWQWSRRTEKAHWAQERAASLKTLMGIGEASGSVLDWGCGFGMDALAYARGGAEVTIADIVPLNLEVARRLLATYGYRARDWLLASETFMPQSLPAFDVVSCNGVLHHDPNPQSLLSYLASTGGEIRLMLYSDKSWGWATKTELPADVRADPMFPTYVRTMDARGFHAEPYSRDRCDEMAKACGYTLASYEYVKPDDVYCVAIMRPNDAKGF